MKWWKCFRSLGFPILAGGLTVLSVIELQANASDFDSYQWSLVNPSSNWAPRAGLEVVYLNDSLFIMGGRTPSDPVADPVFGASTIWGDVWRSDDFGQSWVLDLDTVTPGHWAAGPILKLLRRMGGCSFWGGRISTYSQILTRMARHSFQCPTFSMTFGAAATASTGSR